jgi:hypothetical protein
LADTVMPSCTRCRPSTTTLLAGLEAVLDHPERIDALADFHAAECDFAGAVHDGTL